MSFGRQAGFQFTVFYNTIFGIDTVEPQLSKPAGRHTIRSDKKGVQIDEMESHMAENLGSVGDNP